MEGRIRKGEEAEVLKPGRSEAKIAEVLRGVPSPPRRQLFLPGEAVKIWSFGIEGGTVDGCLRQELRWLRVEGAGRIGL